MSLAVWDPRSELAEMRQSLAGRLQSLSVRIRARLWLDLAARVALACAALGILSFVLDWALELGRPARIVYTVLAVGAVAALFVRSLRGLARLRLGPIELAAELDKARQSPPSQWIAPRVATVIQLSDPQTCEPGFSPPMVDLAVRHSSRSLQDVDFSSQLDERHLRRCAAVLAASIAVPVLFAAMLPPSFSALWARRWILGSNDGWPHDTTLTVVGLNEGRLTVPCGEPAVVRVHVENRRAPVEAVWVRLTPTDGPPETSTLVRYASGDFRYELPPQQQPVRAEFWGGDGRAGPVEIVPVDRPRIARLTLVYKHPRDKAPQTHSFTGEEGNVRLLKQTEAELTLTSNVDVEALDASAEGTTPPRFDRVDERTFRAKWIHQQPLQLKLGLLARESQLASRPHSVAIGFREDRPPRITLTHTGVGLRVSPMAIIPLKVGIRDDFAVVAASLGFKLAANPTTTEKPIVERPKGDLPPFILYDGKAAPPEPAFDATHDWDIEKLKLVPGDTISTTAEATDDCYTGKQTARSRTLSFRVVPAPELFREILQKQQLLRARLRRAEEQAEVLRELMRTAKMSTDADELLRRHNLVQREVWQVLHGIQDSATEMKLNRLGGPETHELIVRTVVSPLEQLHDDMMTRQRQGLESVRQPAGETQQQIVARQQQIIEAMQKILKNMAQWDSFIDVVNQLNEVIKLQQAVRDKTDELTKKQFDSIFNSK